MGSIVMEQQRRILKRLEAVTDYDSLDENQKYAYDEDLKIYRDFQNCMLSSENRGKRIGREEGRKEGRREVIKKLVGSGIPVDKIATILGVSEEDVKKFKQ